MTNYHISIAVAADLSQSRHPSIAKSSDHFLCASLLCLFLPFLVRFHPHFKSMTAKFTTWRPPLCTNEEESSLLKIRHGFLSHHYRNHEQIIRSPSVLSKTPNIRSPTRTEKEQVSSVGRQLQSMSENAFITTPFKFRSALQCLLYLVSIGRGPNLCWKEMAWRH